MEEIKLLVYAALRYTDIRHEVYDNAEKAIERIQTLVDDLCLEEQHMSPSGVEIYQELRKELGL